MQTENDECNSYHELDNSSLRCEFVKNTEACQFNGGFIEYIALVQCDFSKYPLAGLILMAIWWLVLLLALATTADKFFCPALEVMSKMLRLSQNVAGVTLMAFGNGAPDIFAAISAISNAKKGDTGLAVGALIGAGVIITTMVPAAIVLISPFKVMSRPLMRDIVIYLIGLYYVFYILYDGVITTLEAIGLIALYAVYVVIVIVSRSVRQWLISREKQKNKYDTEGVSLLLDEEEQDQTIRRHSTATPTALKNLKPESSLDEHSLLLNKPQYPESQLALFMQAASPIESQAFRKSNWFFKVFHVIRAPVELVLRLTIPVVEERPWCRTLTVFQCVAAPVLTTFAIEESMMEIGDSRYPVWSVALIGGLVLGLVVALTSTNDRPPIYYKLFAVGGFITAVLWIYVIAQEIVNVLQMFGTEFKMSNALLGLTFLAWGNSVGDLVADTAIAKQGFPRMAISACYGTPLFHMLMGLGVGFLLATSKHDGEFELQFDLLQAVLIAALALSLVFSLIALIVQNFYLRRVYAVFLMILYVVFLVIALLVEQGVIDAKIR